MAKYTTGARKKTIALTLRSGHTPHSRMIAVGVFFSAVLQWLVVGARSFILSIEPGTHLQPCHGRSHGLINAGHGLVLPAASGLMGPDVGTSAAATPMHMEDISPFLQKLIDGNKMTSTDMEYAWIDIMKGAVPEQVAGLLCVMRARGETPEEISGCVKGMKNTCIPLNIGGKMLDICGTGGDNANTINISTGAAVLAAASGAQVCKLGNRSASSLCGSADVLEALGININLTPEQIVECFERCGIAFVFAANHYPTMAKVAPIRKALGIRTVFNILGPLSNPANPQHIVLGVCDKNLLSLIANALASLGRVEKAAIVYSCGLDELSPLGASQVLEIQNKAPPGEQKDYNFLQYTIDPTDYGINKCTLEDLQGGDKIMNTRILREVLTGSRHRKMNAKQDAIVMNAGLGLYVYGLTDSIEEGFSCARETLQSGQALSRLDNWITTSNDLTG